MTRSPWSAESIIETMGYQPEVGLILGSGLGALADEISSPHVFNYEDIAGFPSLSVAGHSGRLVLGNLAGKKVVAMQGRSHFYEHGDLDLVSFPVRFIARLGVKSLIVTNACGGIRQDLYPGALVLLTDHINLMGSNPLIGPNRDAEGPRFPDMSMPYSPRLRAIAHAVASSLSLEIFQGVYAAVSGPYYLSKAELRMVRTLGADTIGMSTIPEVIVGTHLGLEILGISCVTDMAIPETLSPLTHDEVIAVAAQTRPKFIKLMTQITSKI